MVWSNLNWQTIFNRPCLDLQQVQTTWPDGLQFENSRLELKPYTPIMVRVWVIISWRIWLIILVVVVVLIVVSDNSGGGSGGATVVKFNKMKPISINKKSYEKEIWTHEI